MPERRWNGKCPSENQPKQTKWPSPGRCSSPWFDKFYQIVFEPRSAVTGSVFSRADSTSAPPAANMSLQHVTTLWYSINDLPCYSRLPQATLFSCSEGNQPRRSTLEVFCNNLKHAMVTRRRASVRLHAWCYQDGDIFLANMRFGNPFWICSFVLLQLRHHIWYIINIECVCIARYCSSDAFWSASAKAIHYPCPSQSRCLVCDNHCMILYAWTKYYPKRKKRLRMQDSTGPIALYLQVLLQFCCFTLLISCCVNSELWFTSTSTWAFLGQ